MFTAHIGLNGSYFLPAGFFEYQTYKVSKIVYSQTKLEVTIYSMYSPHSNSYQVTTVELFKVNITLFRCLSHFKVGLR